jgi:hypothetical protein
MLAAFTHSHLELKAKSLQLPIATHFKVFKRDPAGTVEETDLEVCLPLLKKSLWQESQLLANLATRTELLHQVSLVPYVRDLRAF